MVSPEITALSDQDSLICLIIKTFVYFLLNGDRSISNTSRREIKLISKILFIFQLKKIECLFD